MKRMLALVLVVGLLAGCTSTDTGMRKAMALRESLMASQGCSFNAAITADFGDTSYQFLMNCSCDREGNLRFSVVEPQTIAGITGTISHTGGKLTFDEHALAFSLLADGELSPVSAPWLLMKTLRSGYMTACGPDGELLRLTIDDSYEEDAMQVDVWLRDTTPEYAEILWQGRRIMTLSLENFQFL